MAKATELQSYLSSIRNVKLPEPYSKTTAEFIDYVVNAFPWRRIFHTHYRQPVGMFNFYVTPSPVFEMHDGTGKWFGKFKNLAYGVPYAWNDPRGKIPREICDAGLAVVPDRLADFKSDTSRIIMEVTIANMLSAVQEYRETHAKFLEKYVDLRFFFRTKKEFEEHQRRLRQLGAKAKPGPILGLHAGVMKKRKAATIDDKVN